MKDSSKNMLVQGGILAGASMVTKVIGFAYRIPMSNLLGDEGNGLYSVAFGIYGIALMVSSFSLPLAVSKLVSARVEKGEYSNVRKVISNALIYAIVAGFLVMSLLYFGADAIERFYHRPGLARPLRILAPTTFIVALLGVFRGYFQGYGNMIPTSISQIFEQIANAIISVVATWQAVKIYSSSKFVASYGAAGGTLGTLAGAATALIYLLPMFLLTKNQYQKKDSPNSRVESNSFIVRALVMTIIPIVLSQTMFQIGYTIDDLLFGNLMAVKGYEDKVVSSLQGVFNTQYNQLINLPVTVASSMAASILPSIVASRMKNDIREVHQKITQIIKVNMVIAFPSSVGLAVLADPFMKILFPSLITYRHQAVLLMETGSAAVIFYALSTLTTSILQGNNYMRRPVVHSGISLAIHVVLLAVLLLLTDLNVYALVICNVLFPLVICFLNCRFITEKVGYQWEYKNTFLKPLAASIIMGMVTFVVYEVFRLLTYNLYFASLLAIIAAVIVYAVLILQLQCFTYEELKELPGGSKIIRLLK